MDATTQISPPTAEVIRFLIPQLYSGKLRELLDRQKCGLANREVGIFFLIDEQHPFNGGPVELQVNLGVVPYATFQKIRRLVDQAMKANGGQSL